MSTPVKPPLDGTGAAATHRRVTDPPDTALTFHVQVYRDHWLAQRCLARVRALFPGARLLLVSDGDPDPRWARLAARHAAEYVRGERLYALQHGGAIVQRMLDLFVQAPTPWLLRIDTDTRVHRRFRWLPDGLCLFGTLEHRTHGYGEALVPPCVQGGFIGITRAAAERLHGSGLFSSPRLRDHGATWADTRDTRERARHGRVSFDHLVRYGARQLDITLVEFDEVRSVWRGRIDNRGLRYAATHPHKPWWQLPRLALALQVARLAARWRVRSRHHAQ